MSSDQNVCKTNVSEIFGQPTIKERECDLEERPIGEGSGGTVYKGRWKVAEVDVAVKKILIRKADHENAKIMREIQFLSKLKHENIIEYYGRVDTKSHFWIVMEFAENGSLFDYLKDKDSLDQDLKIKWQLEATRSIEYLQTKDVTHGDIKSPNYVINSHLTLKLCDFGIARHLTKTVKTGNSGTVQWQAPECISEGKLSRKADIFALGVIIWELETCEEPYSGIPSMTVQFKVKDERLELPETLTKRMRQLIQLCWEKSREKRPDVGYVLNNLILYKKGENLN